MTIDDQLILFRISMCMPDVVDDVQAIMKRSQAEFRHIQYLIEKDVTLGRFYKCRDCLGKLIEELQDQKNLLLAEGPDSGDSNEVR